MENYAHIRDNRQGGNGWGINPPPDKKMFETKAIFMYEDNEISATRFENTDFNGLEHVLTFYNGLAIGQFNSNPELERVVIIIGRKENENGN